MDDNYISLMERHPVIQMIQNAPNMAQGTINKYVIKKINDHSDIDLETLRINQQRDIFTQTPLGEWLTFEFIRKERIIKIIGTLYDELRTYTIECQYLNYKKEWVSILYENFQNQLEQNIFPPIGAFGLRFRGKSNVALILQFVNLNIFAKTRNPYIEGKNPWDTVNYLHNKYEIVNIMKYQPFYLKINNLVASYKGAVVTKKFDQSKYDIEEITDNQTQSIHIYCTYPNWLTFEFYKKYKLSKIEIQHYNLDRRYFNYEFEVMDKQKIWKKVVSSKTGYRQIEIDFQNFFPSHGVRIRGQSNVDSQIIIVSIKIFAQRGKPIEIQNI